MPESDLTGAQSRLTGVACGLAQLLGPQQAAQLLLGAGAALLRASQGDVVAVEFLRTLADEVEASRETLQ